MPVRVTERPRRETQAHYLHPGCSRDYLITGTTNELTAQLNLINSLDEQVDGMDIDGNAISLILDHIRMKEEGGGCWSAQVFYESSADVTDLQFTFGTHQEKIYQALRHVRSYDVENGLDSSDFLYQGPNHNGVIGVNGDEVEGVDIESSTIEFVITKRRFRATLPQDYFQILIDIMDLRTPVNDGTRVVKGAVKPEELAQPIELFNPIQAGAGVIDGGFGDDGMPGANMINGGIDGNIQFVGGGFFTIFWKGLRLEFPEGSLRLRGIPVKWTSNDEVEISYHFAYSRPITALDNYRIGQAQIIKEGWEYLWIEYALQTTNGRTKRVAIAAHVEQVYPKRNFNVLDL